MSDRPSNSAQTNSAQTNSADPTADYRRYPKGPNFLHVVISALVVLLLIIGGAVFILHRSSDKLVPQQPNTHPNSSSLPQLSSPDA